MIAKSPISKHQINNLLHKPHSMCIKTLKALSLRSLAALALLTSSCSDLAPTTHSPQYTDGTITLERPAYSNRPYRENQKPAAIAKVRNFNTNAPAELDFGTPTQSPVPFLPQSSASLPTPAATTAPATKYQPPGNYNPLGPSPFHTPDDLSLPTQSQVPNGF